MSLLVRRTSVKHSITIETGISDHHKMTITMMKQYFPKQTPVRVVYPPVISYLMILNIDSIKFREELKNNLELLGDDITYTQFEQTFMGQLDKYAPIKEKSIRANSQPFMNKAIYKAIMNRS